MTTIDNITNQTNQLQGRRASSPPRPAFHLYQVIRSVTELQ